MELIFASLPLECKLATFSFLSMQEVLTYGLVSKDALTDLLFDLHRRYNLLACDFCAFSVRESDGVPKRIVRCRREGAETSPGWTRVPSVLHRVKELLQKMPNEHPKKQSLVEIRRLLMDQESPSLPNLVQPEFDFQDRLNSLRFLTTPHKLHAEILRFAIFNNPFVERETSIHLDRYMGDVLAVSYLMDQSCPQMAEGGPSDATINRLLEEDVPRSVEACYHSWVCVQSSILRTKRFDCALQKRLGIPEFHHTNATRPIPFDCFSQNFRDSEMTLLMNHFGTIFGAAFRGRDVVHLHNQSATDLAHLWISEDVHEESAHLRPTIEWLCMVHQQGRTLRPMTVRPPVVRLSNPLWGKEQL